MLSRLKQNNSRRVWAAHLVKYYIPQKPSRLKPAAGQPDLAKVQYRRDKAMNKGKGKTFCRKSEVSSVTGKKTTVDVDVDSL